jgi:hypothetical protein
MQSLNLNKQTKRFLKITATSLALAFLSGCSNPTMLGLNNSQWGRLSQDQQKSYMKNYRSIQANLKSSSKALPQKTKAANTLLDSNAPLPDVDVTIVKGHAAFPPNFSFTPVATLHVHLTYGLCKSATLFSKNKHQSNPLWFCYTHKMIGIDPSFYKMDQAWGTTFIDTNPLWNRGFTYKHIYTSGFSRLSNATITIRSTAPIDLTPQTVDLTQQVTVDNAGDQTHG